MTEYAVGAYYVILERSRTMSSLSGAVGFAMSSLSGAVGEEKDLTRFFVTLRMTRWILRCARTTAKIMRFTAVVKSVPNRI